MMMTSGLTSTSNLASAMQMVCSASSIPSDFDDVKYVYERFLVSQELVIDDMSKLYRVIEMELKYCQNDAFLDQLMLLAHELWSSVHGLWDDNRNDIMSGLMSDKRFLLKLPYSYLAQEFGTMHKLERGSPLYEWMMANDGVQLTAIVDGKKRDETAHVEFRNLAIVKLRVDCIMYCSTGPVNYTQTQEWDEDGNPPFSFPTMCVMLDPSLFKIPN